MEAFNACFFRFYPRKKKRAGTQAGASLRTALGVSLFMHTVFFIVSLLAIGFYVMLTEIFFISWVYSSYLTLSEWQVIVYEIVLLFGIVHGALSIFSFNNINLLFFILLLIFYGLCFFYTGQRYLTFRAHGGIHGNVGRIEKKKKTHKKKLIDNG